MAAQDRSAGSKRDNLDSRVVTVVAPVYNEEKILPSFVEEVLAVFEQSSFPGRFELLLVNDGSSDGSARLMDQLAAEHGRRIRVIHLSRNYGHESAVSAGLAEARGDAVILMDSDLQDDPAAFHQFIKKWIEGFDVVYAVRSSRREGPLMRLMFWSFYSLLDMLSDVDIPRDAGNFSLMDRRVVRYILEMNERNRYLPGIRAWVGFRQIGVKVDRRGRYDAKPRVGLRSKWTLAMNAIFSFSYVPIFVFRALGVISLLISLVLFVIAVVQGMARQMVFSGLLSPLIWISFFAGINLFGISVVGEYVARIYDEVKARPKYIIERKTENTRDALHEPND